MDSTDKISVIYFSDILCIWAYLAQRRIDELKDKFGAHIDIDYHFLQVFGSVDAKIETSWKDKDGVVGYNKVVRDVAKRFPHIEVHPDVWVGNQPSSSGSCHLFVKAAQILQSKGVLENIQSGHQGVSPVEALLWHLRLAFFRDLKDISQLNVQLTVAEELGLPCDEIEACINSGQAFSALERDRQLQDQFSVNGSPTLILNEGRQIIYGNVGYRVIEANIQELMTHAENQASWC
ncbi:MAG: DsbA family protein [Gammaproteobacteria bacterium]|nr:DsbA family protein [Gammaproteobacteria bacterium]